MFGNVFFFPVSYPVLCLFWYVVLFAGKNQTLKTRVLLFVVLFFVDYLFDSICLESR